MLRIGAGCVTFFISERVISCYAKRRIMFSLQRLLGKEDRFLDLLEACAKEAQNKMLNELLRDLYTKPHDPLKVIFLKETYELLERAVDRCRDAGNVINQIVLKL